MFLRRLGRIALQSLSSAVQNHNEEELEAENLKEKKGKGAT